MKIRFLGEPMDIPESYYNSSIDSDTPQIAFLKSHKTDIQREVGAIKEALEYEWEPDKVPYGPIYDLLAGCGFSGRLFRYLCPDRRLILNDLSEKCYECLKINFREDANTKIYNCRAESVPYVLPDSIHSRASLVFADFNNFTLMKRKASWPIFERAWAFSPRYFMFTDSSCYGFKFQKNLEAYGIKEAREYYERLQSIALIQFGWVISHVRRFGNAAIVFCRSMSHEDLDPGRKIPVFQSDTIIRILEWNDMRFNLA